jgi:FKBP-type peptidyl-prolyl cis-trans isomerase 2
MSPHSRTLWKITILPLLLSTISGCASGRPIISGDRVAVQFTCWQQTGQIAASSYLEVNNSSRPKSALFVKRDRGDAVVIEAGAAKAADSVAKRKSFEDEILERLAGVLPGMRPGEQTRLEISAERLSALPPEEQYVKITRVWKQAKEMRMSPERYRALAKQDPALGQKYAVYNSVPGKVESVSGDEVLVRFAPAVREVKLPYGMGIIKEKDDHYEIDVQAVVGTLVRIGGLAGRISQVDEQSMTLDFGHPLGGETLKCEVRAETVQPAEPAKAATAAAVPARAAVETVKATATAVAVPAQAATAAAEVTATGSGTFTPTACAGDTDGKTACGPTAEAGDLATVNFSASLADGTLIATTLESAAKDPARHKSAVFQDAGLYPAEEIAVGRSELFPGLGEALLGMKAGEKKTVHLTPEQAFGRPDPKKEAQFPLQRDFPKAIRMSAEDYAKRFAGFPSLNKEVDLVPFFKARVTEVTDHDVALEFLAEDGKTVSESYGTVSIGVAGDRISTRLTPKMGASFPLKEGEGVIVASDGSSFTVDGNSPLAGKEVVLELELLSLAKASAAAGAAIDWVENYDGALALSKNQGKPTFLVLYADWCGWCKKTFTEVLPDPRLSWLKDKFVWARVNSDKETKYRDLYQQEGFPLMLVLNPDGSLKKRINGFKDVRALKTELEGVL